jgi:hypothetical protein
MSAVQSSTAGVDAEKVAFIEAALANGVLLFGEFTLKSGRSVDLILILILIFHSLESITK